MRRSCSRRPRIRSSPTSTRTGPARRFRPSCSTCSRATGSRPRCGRRSLQPDHDLRLPVRPGQDLRVPEPRRQRAVHLPAAVRSARARRAAARSRDLPAGADRRPAAPRCADARRDAEADALIPTTTYLRELNEAYHHFFFHYTATPLLVVETSQFDSDASDEVARRSDAADRGHGPGHAVLRAADDSESAVGSPAAAASHRHSELAAATLTSILYTYLHTLISCAPWPGSRRAASPSRPPDKPSRVPEGLWVKCPGCAQVIYNKDLATNLSVCPKCAHHFRLSAAERLRMLFDGEWDGVRQRASSRPTR